MVPGILRCVKKWDDGSDSAKHQILLMEGLNCMYDSVHDSGITMTPAQALEFQKATQKFVMEYTWLANFAMREGKNMYSVVPKHHYAVHLSQQSDFINPRFTWCYKGEDFVGKLSRLAHVCLYGTPCFNVAGTLCERYPVAIHLKFTRQ
jgi:hypothetical protein